MAKWSRDHEFCVVCGLKEHKHVAKGLCFKCYSVQNNSSNRGKSRENIGNASNKLTKEFLIAEYIGKNRSLGDIAKESSCSRVYVSQKMKEFGIKTRTKKMARTLALEKGKISFDLKSDTGTNIKKTLGKITLNERFFSIWSQKMAWVLGVVFTDGNIDPGTKVDKNRDTRVQIPRLSINQKEPELLEKVKKAMDCNASLYFRKEHIYNGIKSGATYSLSIARDSIYEDLKKIGLNPDKSLNMLFPDVPGEFLRDFIRGCWDGDGSVFISAKHLHASYVCGSREFIYALKDRLISLGLKDCRVYEQVGKNMSYKIRYTGSECRKLFKILYDKVDSDLYLKRKYDVFSSYYLEKPECGNLF